MSFRGVLCVLLLELIFGILPRWDECRDYTHWPKHFEHLARMTERYEHIAGKVPAITQLDCTGKPVMDETYWYHDVVKILSRFPSMKPETELLKDDMPVDGFGHPIIYIGKDRHGYHRFRSLGRNGRDNAGKWDDYETGQPRKLHWTKGFWPEFIRGSLWALCLAVLTFWSLRAEKAWGCRPCALCAWAVLMTVLLTHALRRRETVRFEDTWLETAIFMLWLVLIVLSIWQVLAMIPRAYTYDSERKKRRLRQCIQCKYDLSHTPLKRDQEQTYKVCPECGVKTHYETATEIRKRRPTPSKHFIRR